MSDYKYLKYKNKYINNKNQSGGGDVIMPLYYEAIPTWYFKKLPQMRLIESYDTYKDINSLKSYIAPKITSDYINNEKIVNIMNIQNNRINYLYTLIYKYKNNELIKLVNILKKVYSAYYDDLIRIIDYNMKPLIVKCLDVMNTPSTYAIPTVKSIVTDLNTYITDYNSKETKLYTDMIKQFIIAVINILIHIKTISSEDMINNIKEETISLLYNRLSFLTKIKNIIDYLGKPYDKSSILLPNYTEDMEENNNTDEKLNMILEYIKNIKLDKNISSSLEMMIAKNLEKNSISKTQLINANELLLDKSFPLYQQIKSGEYIGILLLIQYMITSEQDINIDITDNSPTNIDNIINKLNTFQSSIIDYEIQENKANNIINTIRMSLNMTVV